MKNLVLPQISSLGLILSYQCSNECRHCLYACAPGWKDWITDEVLDRILSQVSRHARFLTGIHLSGGEPFLQPGLLNRAVRALVRRNLPIDYVETNAFWCHDDGAVEASLLGLKQEGLPALLVSASPFHSEFIPIVRVERAVRVGRRVFGPAGVLLYTDYFFEQLRTADPDYPIPFEDYLESVGLETAAFDIADRYGLVPNGRAPLELGALYAPKPAGAFFGADCRAELTSPYHVHIDLYGNTISGLCAGLSVGSGFDLDTLVAGIDLSRKPVLAALSERGVEGLHGIAVREFGFREDPGGYIAKCHLCLDMRRHLVRSGAAFEELAPREFYGHLS